MKMSEKGELFHVSCNQYSIEQVLDANEFDETIYHRLKREQGSDWIDTYLDERKPSEAPSRKQTLFAFDSVGKAKAFIGNRCESNPIYYRVEMVDPVSCPMHLVGLISDSNSSELNERIADEYWNPKNDWQYLEYLSSKMRIVSIVDASDFMLESAGRMAIGLDYDKAKNMFKQ